MNIKMEDIQKEGFEIIEEVFGAYVAAPIKLDAVGGDYLDNLDYGTYDIDESLQNINCGKSETLFSLKKDGIILLIAEPLETVKEFLEEYFREQEEGGNING